MKPKILYTALVFGLIFNGLLFAQNQDLFKTANSLYNEGKYQEAINSYKTILDTGNHSAELYFNLANAHYKLNQIAPSIYYYEKAKQLSPKDKDIINNLAFANNMTIDNIETIPDIGFSKIIKNITNLLRLDTWAWLAVIAMFWFIFLFLKYYLTYSTSYKRAYFVSSFLAILIMLICLSFAFQKHQLIKQNNPAIIFATQAEIKSEPNLRSEVLFALHEGTKVQVREKYDANWVKIELSDGKTGWISKDDIKLLNRI